MTRGKDRPAAGKAGKGRTGILTDEDHALWTHVAGSVEPVRRAKPRVPLVEAAASPEDGRQRAAVVPQKRARAGHIQTHPVAAPAHAPPTQKHAPPLATFDRKRQRRIAAGRLEIEARLDLHGARLADAHPRLRAFILRAVEKGYSTVIVVTGKGGARPGKAEDIASPYATPERGVLRRSVPLWLEQPDLRSLVASYTTAAVQHGGEGAIYIHLRRRKPRD